MTSGPDDAGKDDQTVVIRDGTPVWQDPDDFVTFTRLGCVWAILLSLLLWAVLVAVVFAIWR